MKREFLVVEDEEEYGQVIVSLAAMEVRSSPSGVPRRAWGRCVDLWVNVGR
jgi:hypothetical protein